MALRQALDEGAGRSRKQRVSAVELDSFQGVADLVTGEFNGRHLLPDEVPRSKLKMFSFSTAKVLAALVGRRRACISELESVSGLAQQTVRRELQTLKKAGLVDTRQHDQVRMLREIRAPFREIVAYEVKVKDWKSGLRQALSYKSFANRTYLALPLDRADLVKKYHEVFRRFNVGLLGVGRGGKPTWFTTARKLRPISPARNIFASIQLLRNASPALFRSSAQPLQSPRHQPSCRDGRARFEVQK
jgi:DNA-binding transcriptional ArsR family regulator